MEKKHLSIGTLISLTVLTFFLYHLKGSYDKSLVDKQNWIGVVNGHNVYIPDVEKDLDKSFNDYRSRRDFFDAYVDHHILSLEAKKIGISKAKYLSFFDSIKKLEPTKEEKTHFPDSSDSEIKGSRISRAKKNLLKLLRKQNKISYRSE